MVKNHFLCVTAVGLWVMPVGNACAYGHNTYTTQLGTAATRMLEDRLVLGSNFEEQNRHSNGYAKTVV